MSPGTVSKNKLSHIEFELWCDNEAVVKVLQPTRDGILNDLTSAESDLVQVARGYLRQLKKVTVQHVYGHQEDHVPFSDLPYESQLNVDCDERAKECMWASEIGDERPDPTPGSGPSFTSATIW